MQGIAQQDPVAVETRGVLLQTTPPPVLAFLPFLLLFLILKPFLS